MEDVSVFVLAGGRSSRMGTDKALLSFGGENLLQLALRKAGEISPYPVIVGSRGLYGRYGQVVEDVFPGCGPLGGIHAGLCATQTNLSLVLPVDMPLVPVAFLHWLVRLAIADPSLMVVPGEAAHLQPLCATYRKEVLPVVEQELKAGHLKVENIFSHAKTRRISPADLVAAGFGPEIFRNLNTPEEYRAVRESQADELPRTPQEPLP